MRLLHSKSLEFKEFFNRESTPPYAILSHTWGDDEVTFEDMLGVGYKTHLHGSQAIQLLSKVQGRGGQTIKSKAGFKKIRYCAEQASRDGLDYFWVDTCCIDKSSSAELSEAINSMFRWYRDSKVCYAYLSDVSIEPHMLPNDLNELKDLERFRFAKAKWFTRGWTLQELIGPRSLHFYTAEWTLLGSKRARVLTTAISERTQIPTHVLLTGDFSRYSAAQKMMWAASRLTTRVEDKAYSLLGLFEIHMPLLYGEGNHAFVRLQEEIIRHSDDLSIFAWKNPHADTFTYRGLLARSPSEFMHCSDVGWDRVLMNQTLDVSSKEIKLDVVLKQRDGLEGEYLALLPGVGGHNRSEWKGIYLQKASDDRFVRVDARKLDNLHESGMTEDIPNWIDDTATDMHNVCVRNSPIFAKSSFAKAREIVLSGDYARVLEGDGRRGVEVRPKEAWDEAASVLSFKKRDQREEDSSSNAEFSFDFLGLTAPLVVNIDRRKRLEECISVTKPWFLFYKQEKYNGGLCLYQNEITGQVAQLELALVLKWDKCVLDMVVSWQ